MVLNFKTRERKEEKNKDRVYFIKKRHIRMLMGTSWYNRIDQYLREGNYPYGFTPESFVFLHILSMATGFILWLRSGNSTGIKIMMLMPIYLNIMVFHKRKRVKERFQMELCNIQDIIYFQSKIDTPQDVILAYAAKAASEPLKTPLSNFAEKFMLNKDINKALEEFRQTSRLMEFQAFTFIIEQRQSTGFSDENHKAQSTMLKRSKRMKRRIDREYKRTKLIIAAVMLFACYIAFVSVPLLNSVLKSIDTIFR